MVGMSRSISILESETGVSDSNIEMLWKDLEASLASALISIERAVVACAIHDDLAHEVGVV